MRRSTRIDGSAGGEPLSCGTQSTYNRVANAGNLHRLSPFQMPFGILHNLTGKSSLTFSIEKCHFITAIVYYMISMDKQNPILPRRAVLSQLKSFILLKNLTFFCGVKKYSHSIQFNVGTIGHHRTNQNISY